MSVANIEREQIEAWLADTDPQEVGRVLQPWLKKNDGMTIRVGGSRYRLRCWYMDPSGPDR